jgi:two-component system, NarL family, response regulator DevR
VLLDWLRLAIGQSLLLRQIHQNIAGVRTVIVGMEPNEESFLNAIREGVAGYVLRDASAAEVLSAIRAVAGSEAVWPPTFSSLLFRCAAQQLTIRQNLQSRSRSELSRREHQLVELICWRLTNKEIAARLHLSEHTVKNHIHRILHKTGAPDRISIIDRYHAVEQCAPEGPRLPLSQPGY